MAVDVLVTEELLDAVLAELAAHLPATWLQSGNATTEAALKVMECGDLMDYCGNDAGLIADTPAVFVRPLEATVADGHGGTGAVEVINHKFRLVHVRRFEQCYTAAGVREKNMTRARMRYAKELGRALFADKNKRLDNPTLTTATGSTAKIMIMTMDGWDFGTEAGGSSEVAVIRAVQSKGPQMWAISVDFTIMVRVTPT